MTIKIYILSFLIGVIGSSCKGDFLGAGGSGDTGFTGSQDSRDSDQHGANGGNNGNYGGNPSSSSQQVDANGNLINNGVGTGNGYGNPNGNGSLGSSGGQQIADCSVGHAVDSEDDKDFDFNDVQFRFCGTGLQQTPNGFRSTAAFDQTIKLKMKIAADCAQRVMIRSLMNGAPIQQHDQQYRSDQSIDLPLKAGGELTFAVQPRDGNCRMENQTMTFGSHPDRFRTKTCTNGCDF